MTKIFEANAEARDLTLVDTLPSGFVYVPGSARLDGVAVEARGRQLSVAAVDIPARGSVALTLKVRIGASESKDALWST